MQETGWIKEVLPSASLTKMTAKATILNIEAPYIREGSKYSEILHMILKLRRRPAQVDIRLKQVCSHDVLRERRTSGSACFLFRRPPGRTAAADIDGEGYLQHLETW